MNPPKHDRQELPLDLLIEHAGATPRQPPLPAGGIPRQWIPAFIRWPIRLFMTPFVILDQFIKKVAAFLVQTPFKMAGSCKKRGNCCYFVLLPEPKGLLGRLFYFWYTQINGFYWRGLTTTSDKGNTMHVMGCRYLKKDGSCAHHKLRPALCREWPVIAIWGRPQILKGCGFRAEPRHKSSEPNDTSSPSLSSDKAETE
jgi:hypothetical protein